MLKMASLLLAAATLSGDPSTLLLAGGLMALALVAEMLRALPQWSMEMLPAAEAYGRLIRGFMQRRRRRRSGRRRRRRSRSGPAQ